MKKSQLWEELASSLFGNIDAEFLTSFRKPGGANNRLAAWDPFDPTARYFKFLLYNIARNEDQNFFTLYKKLENTDIGSPMHITVNDCKINIDYLFSIQEILFLEDAINLSDLRNVVEIGAGFGRTCHALIVLASGITNYKIIDLPEVLQLSKAYLREALPEEKYNLVQFIDCNDYTKEGPINSDLVINVDSFQEMPEDVINQYLKTVVLNSRYFYTKNPIGKYSPSSVGIDDSDKRKFHDVFSLGLCRDVIDIFDEDELVKARELYIENYRPGKNWTALSNAPLSIFPYLHNVLYERPES